MRVIRTDRAPSPGGKRGKSYAVIVVDPMPELTAPALIMELRTSTIGTSKALISARVVQGGHVRVVVVDFAIAKYGLEQSRELPAFRALLPTS